MCSGAFGKFQNFRHNAQMGFGIIPQNSLAGQITKFEAGLEDSVAGGTEHGTKDQLDAKHAKAAAEAAAKEAAAIEDAKKSSETAKQKQKEADDYNTAQLAQLSEEEKMKQTRSLLAQDLIVSDQPKTKKVSTTKVTLLGG